MVKDMPEGERGLLAELPKSGYLRKVVPQQEFDRLYTQVSVAEDRKLYSTGTFLALAHGTSFNLEDFPVINSVCTGNFVDVIMENAVYKGVVDKFIPSK